jgi:hypothetical protein
MHYFKWSGVLAIRTMQCIPMLFLFNTLHLYYTPVGLLARLLILLPYVDLVCQLRQLLSSSLLTSSSSCTAATLTDLIVFLFLLHAMPASCFILFLNSISNLCPSLDSQSWRTSSCSWLYRSIPSLFQGIFFCPSFVYFALAGLTLLGMALSPCYIYSTSCFHGSR